MYSEGRVTRSRSRSQGGLTPAPEAKANVRNTRTRSKTVQHQGPHVTCSVLSELTNTVCSADSKEDTLIPKNLVENSYAQHISEEGVGEENGETNQYAQEAKLSTQSTTSSQSLLDDSAVQSANNVILQLDQNPDIVAPLYADAFLAKGIEQAPGDATPEVHNREDGPKDSFASAELDSNLNVREPLALGEEASNTQAQKLFLETDGQASFRADFESDGTLLTPLQCDVNTAVPDLDAVHAAVKHPNETTNFVNLQQNASFGFVQQQTERESVELTPGHLFSAVKREITLLDRTPHPGKFLDSFHEGDFRRKEVKEFLKECPHQPVQSWYALDPDSKCEEQRSLLQTPSAELNDKILDCAKVTFSLGANAEQQPIQLDSDSCCAMDATDEAMAEPAKALADGRTVEIILEVSGGISATVGLDDRTAAMQAMVPNQSFSPQTTSEADIEKGTGVCDSPDKTPLPADDSARFAVNAAVSPAVEMQQIESQSPCIQAFAANSADPDVKKEQHEAFPVPMMDRWEMDGENPAACNAAIITQEQLPAKLKSKVVCAPAAQNMLQKPEEQSLRQLKKAIAKVAAARRSAVTHRNEPESSVDTSQMPQSSTTSTINTDNGAVDGPCCEDDLCSAMNELNVDLKLMRGIPAPQGRHWRFSDDGQVVESPTSRYTYLRGVPPATGKHTRFED